MSDSRLISVIVPVYNAEKHIARCIDSLLRQTYANYEVILVNDGSTDESLEICERYRNQDHRIIVLSESNGGASKARNIGLRAARGEYIAFIDSDDFVAETYLEDLLNTAIAGDYGIVQCKHIEVSENANPITVSNHHGKNNVETITIVDALNKRIYKVSVWAKIYRRSVFDGFSFREGIIYEDDASYYKLAYKAGRIGLLEKALYYYCMTSNSVMRNDSTDKSLAFVDIYKERISYFAELNDPALEAGSIQRFCIVLMLFISNARTNGNNEKDLDMLWSLFKENYSAIKASPYVSNKDKFMLTLFRRMPKLLGKAICFLQKRRRQAI